MKFGQQMNSVHSKIVKVEQRTVNHDMFLKVLAYKSIDIEVRSRRCNLVFHGLAESKNEHLDEILLEFMWSELGIDSDALLIDCFNRLIFILTVPRRYFCCGSLLLLVLAVRIYTLVQLLC